MSFDCFQFHLVCRRTFTRQDVLTLKIAVHHHDGGCVPVKVPHDHRHGFQSGKFTGIFSAVSRNNLLPAVFAGTDDCRDKNTVFLDAVHGVPHGIIVPKLKRMSGEGTKFGKRNVNDSFRCVCIYGFSPLFLE